MELQVRSLEEEDFEHLDKWWYEWNGSVVDHDILPKTGFIAEHNSKPVSAIFMFKTNSNSAAIQWVVSDKNYREDNRNLILKELIKACEDEWRKEGGKFLFFWGNIQSFNNNLKEIGFATGDTGYEQLIKKI